MKALGMIKILTLVTCLYFVYSGYLYSESHESVMDRLYWNRNHTNLITGGLVDFEYSEEKGTHCVAKKDLYLKKFTFRIPKEYLLCGCK
jgi:hypothetical protein